MKHTKGRLFYSQGHKCLGYSGGWVARIDHKRQGDDPHGDTDADGDRLAAAWNACRGVPTWILGALRWILIGSLISNVVLVIVLIRG